MKSTEQSTGRISKSEREILGEDYCTLGAPTANEIVIAQFEKNINTWAEASVGGPESEDRRPDGLRT